MVGCRFSRMLASRKRTGVRSVMGCGFGLEVVPLPLLVVIRRWNDRQREEVLDCLGLLPGAGLTEVHLHRGVPK